MFSLFSNSPSEETLKRVPVPDAHKLAQSIILPPCLTVNLQFFFSSDQRHSVQTSSLTSVWLGGGFSVAVKFFLVCSQFLFRTLVAVIQCLGTCLWLFGYISRWVSRGFQMFHFLPTCLVLHCLTFKLIIPLTPVLETQKHFDKLVCPSPALYTLTIGLSKVISFTFTMMLLG